ncbi:uncharacterized protein N7479_003494 [Penicillium vulpinum]|uniref:uncharacterized protein n=1 Tax=Penicillium vulpinum TaxID=29845 RepID=UPI002548CAF7|nr:uncharacterized protein N7479_003494 [Penicillium vulpinum]KAJ5963618.1 hypothetical protein N7479_003494 [Penicillium vulpinum]
MRLHEKFGHVLTLATLVNAIPSKSGHTSEPSCRFAHHHSQKQNLQYSTSFINDMLYWEGKFHQNNISYNSNNGISYDGSNIDWVTGEATEKHTFSAASKESLQIMLYAHAIAGSPEAARFLSPENLAKAPTTAASTMQRKLQTYLKFNETYPGFGGFLPWVTADIQDITPRSDWANACLDSIRGDGRVCAVVEMKDQSLPVSHSDQTYVCESKDLLDDPFEGEIFTFWLQFFGGLSKADKETLWEVKKPQSVSVDYEMGGFGPITIQKGFWFSSHKTWKVMQMPYYDIDIVRRVFENAERVRTCNSVATKLPGMFPSINNITDPSTGDVTGYISNADIYGSTEATRVDGTGVSVLLTWDSKITTVVATLGGVNGFVRQKMKADNLYDEFVDIIDAEYSRVFKHLKGENVNFCLPQETDCS